MVEKSAKNALVRLLAKRDYFSFELRQRLLDRGFSQKEIEPALKEMRQAGYLDDKRRSILYVKDQLKKGYGPRAIAFKLRAKGGSSSYLPSIEEQVEAILAFVKKRKKEPQDFISRQKLMAHLFQRGFELQAIEKSLAKE